VLALKHLEQQCAPRRVRLVDLVVRSSRLVERNVVLFANARDKVDEQALARARGALEHQEAGAVALLGGGVRLELGADDHLRLLVADDVALHDDRLALDNVSMRAEDVDRVLLALDRDGRQCLEQQRCARLVKGRLVAQDAIVAGGLHETCAQVHNVADDSVFAAILAAYRSTEHLTRAVCVCVIQQVSATTRSRRMAMAMAMTKIVRDTDGTHQTQLPKLLRNGQCSAYSTEWIVSM